MRTGRGLGGRVMEAYYLLSSALGGAEAKVQATVNNVEATKARVRKATGVDLKGMHMLDIGPGQQLRHMRAFSADNDVEGIDMDIIPQELSIAAYTEMLKRNSVTRVAKTLVRKGIGVDRRFESQLAAKVGLEKFKVLPIHRMDAAAMTFPDGHFDCVYSYSVFEHIDRPEAALQEVKRTLKPGGIAYISVHIYSSHSGQHDPKMLVQDKPEPPLWPHLRDKYKNTVAPSAYLNKVRFDEWTAMFERVMPGVRWEHEKQEYLLDQLKEIHAAGEMADWSEEELLTLNFIAIWQKPKS